MSQRGWKRGRREKEERNAERAGIPGWRGIIKSRFFIRRKIFFSFPKKPVCLARLSGACVDHILVCHVFGNRVVNCSTPCLKRDESDVMFQYIIH